MIRRTGGSGIRRYSQEGGSELANPLETVANLSDVMLVFAVALMLALISHWGVDVAKTQLDAEDMQQVDQDVSEQVASSIENGSSYEEVGVMYRDKETGEYYVLQPQ